VANANEPDRRFPSGQDIWPFYALLGPSGSGKTTLLRMIAGFDRPDSGHVEIGGEPVEGIPVEKRDVGMMFQNYALFPNMTVYDNVAFGLTVRRTDRAEIKRRVAEALELVQLSGFEKRRPSQVSGGQKQRVALARAIVIRPRVLLLDEPLSALDKALRLEMQVELKRIQREVGITTIFVTHDQEEALTLSDRIGVLNEGRLVQEGAPHEIYEHPKSAFAASFLGDANLLRGSLRDGAVALADGAVIRLQEPPKEGANEVILAVRPEKMSIRKGATVERESENQIEGTVLRQIFAGSSLTYLVRWQEETLKVFVQNRGEEPIALGEKVTLSWSPAHTIPVAP
jgi:spermidine/putrescine ABC transporter ATP-binding subunit